MTEEEMIKEIAEPILEQLKKIEKQLGNQRMPQLPQIKFVKEGDMNDGPFMIGDIEVTDELLEKVEAYIQDEIHLRTEEFCRFVVCYGFYHGIIQTKSGFYQLFTIPCGACCHYLRFRITAFCFFL